MRLRPLDDRREVSLHFIDGLPAEDVVRSELKNHNAHFAVERPVDSPYAAGRSISGNSRVYDFVVEAVRIELLLKQRRVARGLLQSESRGQAIAERDYLR